MKKIALSFLLKIFTLTLFAQTQFEGKVVHAFTAEQDKRTGTIEIYYGNKKIKGIKKITGEEKKEADDDDLIIDFSKGVVYNINHLNRTYRIDSIKNKMSHSFPSFVPIPEKNKLILNRSCSAFSLDSSKKNVFTDKMNFLFWYADSLHFSVDDKYLISDDMAVFTNGKTICMGIKIIIDDHNVKKTAELTPVLVTPMHLADSIFEIPADYILEVTGKQYIQETPVDSTVMVQIATEDSAIKSIKSPGVSKKKTPAKSTPNKSAVKSPANKRKE